MKLYRNNGEKLLNDSLVITFNSRDYDYIHFIKKQYNRCVYYNNQNPEFVSIKQWLESWGYYEVPAQELEIEI